MDAGGDTDRASRLVPKFAERCELRFNLVQARTDDGKQALPWLCRSDAAGGAGQQPYAEPLLKPADGVAERRWRNTHLRGGAGEAALPCDCPEGEQVVDV